NADNVENINVVSALTKYVNCFVPLHYHELWFEIMHDSKDVETDSTERQTKVNVHRFIRQSTSEDEDEENSIPTTLIVGDHQTLFTDTFKHLNSKLSLFDIVLITINKINYFGIIVHVKQTKVKRDDNKDKKMKYGLTTNNINDNNVAQNIIKDRNRLRVDLHTRLVIYVSKKCSDELNKYHSKDKEMKMFKLSNITSSRRMISAIYNLTSFPQYKSLLAPMLNDEYFCKAEIANDSGPNNQIIDGFNINQSQTIRIANNMFEDIQERMHILHGPPGRNRTDY
ncbi:unnamed protein product, partial [Didymodactylos carnosus]